MSLDVQFGAGGCVRPQRPVGKAPRLIPRKEPDVSDSIGGTQDNDATSSVLGSSSSRRGLLAGGLGAAASLGLADLVRPTDALAAVNDSVFDQGGAIYNVKASAYGAVGNGTTDDTAAIKSAIAAANNSGKGGIVYFPPGTYLVSSVLDLGYANGGTVSNGISLIGAGPGASLIKSSSSFTTGEIVTITQKNNCSIRHLTITAATVRTSGAAIKISGNGSNSPSSYLPSSTTVDDVDLEKQFIGIDITDASGSGPERGAWVIRIDRGEWRSFAANGIGCWIRTVYGGQHFVSNILMSGPVYGEATQPAAGIRVQATGDLTLHAVTTIQTTDGLLVDPGSGQTVAALFCTSCDFDTPGSGNGITINADGGGQAVQLNFVNCWTNNSQVNNGIYIGGNVDRVNIIGHRAYRNYTNGIWVNAGGATNISIDSSEFSGNNLANGGHAGIRLGSTGNAMSDVQVRNCRATGSGSISTGGTSYQAYGIIVASGTNDYMIVANNFRGNLTGARSDSGGSNKVVANNLES